jgi:small conductance mechanosensitive channel
MPDPVASAVPALLAPDLADLLSGQVHWSREFAAQAVHWLWDTGWTIMLVVALTWITLKAYDTLLMRLFGLLGANVTGALPQARLAQRITTLSAMLRSLGKVVISFLAGMIVLSKMGVNIVPVLASAGIVGLAVGFGAQSLVKDVISGFFIIVEDQYGVGDLIEVGTAVGIVEKMNLRITQVRGGNGSLITIPNGSVSTVINHSKEWARAVLEIGVSYNEDPDRVMAVLRSLGEELRAELPAKVIEPIEILGVEAFKDAEVVIKVQLKTAPLEQWAVSRAFRRKIWFKFKELNIEMPFPQKALWLASASERSGADAPPRGETPARPPSTGA